MFGLIQRAKSLVALLVIGGKKEKAQLFPITSSRRGTISRKMDRLPTEKGPFFSEKEEGGREGE